jgi:hypothetical protein
VDPLEPYLARWKTEYGVTSALEVADPSPGRVAALEPSDLVIVRSGRALAGSWRDELRTLGRLARKLLVVVTSNPDRAGFRAGQALGLGPPDGEMARTELIAPVLWELGRVRDHVYLDSPRWADATSRLGRRLARLHAFAVDMRPRTPQARRRLTQVS